MIREESDINHMDLPKLNLPTCRFKVRKGSLGEVMIWDGQRKCWLVLTPEEWVRQHVLRMLTDMYGVDPGMIRQECPVELNGMSQRADIVVYGNDGHPRLLAECKAPYAGVDSSAYAQAVRYNTVINAEYIFITDGMIHFIYRRSEDGGYVPQEHFPELR